MKLTYPHENIIRKYPNKNTVNDIFSCPLGKYKMNKVIQ